MNKKEIIEKFYDTTEATYYRHKKQNRPVIMLIEKYFSEEDLEEFLTIGKISKLEEQKENEENYNTFMLIDYVKYNLKEKLDKILLKPGVVAWLETVVSKGIFLQILKEISEDPKIEVEKYKSKEYLIEKIKNYKVVTIKNPKKRELIEVIKNNLSNIECYVLIKYTSEFLKK